MAESQPATASLREPDNTLAEIEKLGTAVSTKLKLWSRPDWEHVFVSVEQKASEYVDTLITSSVGPDAVAEKPPPPPTADFIEVIKGRREKLALTSSTTDQIVGICKQILAFGVAGLALSVGFSDKIHSFSIPVQKLIVLGGVFYVELVLLSLVVLIWYLLQAHFRYPFLYFEKIGNAWPYFYYSSISRTVNRSPIQTARTRVEAGTSFAKDFVKFSEACLKETPEQRLRAELQQYFLLVSYQGYVQQFALRLANIFFYGFVGAAVSTALIWVWSAAK
jgi:hypothetical protein